MGNAICLLVDVLYEGGILSCAIKIDRDDFDLDFPESIFVKDAVRALLPLHVRSCGPVIRVQEIFEVHIAKKARGE